MRLLVKEILVGDDTIIIRHSIPLPASPSGDKLPPSEGPELFVGKGYLLCSGRNDAALRRAHRRRVQRAELDDAAWDGAMVAGWSASALGMLWPESDAACVVAGGDGGVLPAAARRPVVIIAAS